MITRSVIGAIFASVVLAATVQGLPAVGEVLPDKSRLTNEYTRGIVDSVPYGFTSWDSLLAVQDRLTAAADSIVAATGPVAESGYSSIKLSVADNSLTVYWSGQVPPQVEAAIDARPAGITVYVSQVTHSLIEMQQQMTSLLERADAAGIELLSVGPRPDSSGLQATVAGDVAKAQQILASSIPLTIITGTDSEPMFNRSQDTNPYWGGARYRTWKGDCSTGFAIRTSGRSAHSEPNAMLTAAHCAKNGYGDDAWLGGDSYLPNALFFGFNNHLDTAYVSAKPGYAMSPYIYRGPVGSSSYSGVAYTVGTYVGQWVCQGGAQTGEHCGAQVTMTEQSTPDGKVHVARAQIMTYDPYFKVWLPDIDEVAVGKGDSGGPVFIPAVGTSKIYAMGTVIGGSTYGGFPCPQYGTSCSSGFSWTPIKYTLEATGATIATSP
ncbi:hypothetical protein [Actinokineospora sp. HUAS TT18]|uniref:hypothetical protein n=1 Tax=Actinokineospora sp. HUAS TT18 TaxID=3447451 RepID=UPI003F527C89